MFRRKLKFDASNQFISNCVCSKVVLDVMGVRKLRKPNFVKTYLANFHRKLKF